MAPENNLERKAARHLADAGEVKYTEALRRLRESGVQPTKILDGTITPATILKDPSSVTIGAPGAGKTFNPALLQSTVFDPMGSLGFVVRQGEFHLGFDATTGHSVFAPLKAHMLLLGAPSALEEPLFADIILMMTNTASALAVNIDGQISQGPTLEIIGAGDYRNAGEAASVTLKHPLDPHSPTGSQNIDVAAHAEKVNRLLTLRANLLEGSEDRALPPMVLVLDHLLSRKGLGKREHTRVKELAETWLRTARALSVSIVVVEDDARDLSAEARVSIPVMVATPGFAARQLAARLGSNDTVPDDEYCMSSSGGLVTFVRECPPTAEDVAADDLRMSTRIEADAEQGRAPRDPEAVAREAHLPLDVRFLDAPDALPLDYTEELFPTDGGTIPARTADGPLGRSGLMIVGRPGSGKTTLMTQFRAGVTEAGRDTYWVSREDLDTLSGLPEFIDRRGKRDAILFVDELDVLRSEERMTGPKAVGLKRLLEVIEHGLPHGSLVMTAMPHDVEPHELTDVPLVLTAWQDLPASFMTALNLNFDGMFDGMEARDAADVRAVFGKGYRTMTGRYATALFCDHHGTARLIRVTSAVN